MKMVENVKEIRCYYLDRDSEHNWCRLENNDTGMDEIFKDVNYLSVNNTIKTNANLFSQSETPARPDLHIEFKEPIVCKVEAYSGYKFEELKIINCGRDDNITSEPEHIEKWTEWMGKKLKGKMR